MAEKGNLFRVMINLQTFYIMSYHILYPKYLDIKTPYHTSPKIRTSSI